MDTCSTCEREVDEDKIVNLKCGRLDCPYYNGTAVVVDVAVSLVDPRDVVDSICDLGDLGDLF
jgi:hypothetical protein